MDVQIEGDWIEIISVYNNTSCEEMKEDIEELLEADVASKMRIVGGDLNGRIGKLGASDPESERATRDPVINEEGERWVDLWDTFGIGFLNGNTAGDLEGEVTHPGLYGQEASVIDYAGASFAACGKVTFFKIGDRNESDHFPLEVTLNSKAKSSPAGQPVVLQKWDTNNKVKFKERLKNGPSAYGWGQVHKKLWEGTPKVTIVPGSSRRAKSW